MKIFMILGAIIAAFVVFAIVDSKEMERQNCQRTGNSRDDIIWQYIYDAKGNVMSMYPQVITEYEYKCNDRNRWR